MREKLLAAVRARTAQAIETGHSRWVLAPEALEEAGALSELMVFMHHGSEERRVGLQRSAIENDVNDGVGIGLQPTGGDIRPLAELVSVTHCPRLQGISDNRCPRPASPAVPSGHARLSPSLIGRLSAH